jgi:hypothetical protein
MKRKIFCFLLVSILLGLLAGCGPGSIVQIGTPGPITQTGASAPGGQINIPGLSDQVYVPAPNPLIGQADTQGRIASLVQGIWHGFISPVTLGVSFVRPEIQMYEVHNDGSLYNLGFFLGVGIVFLILGWLVNTARHR